MQALRSYVLLYHRQYAARILLFALAAQLCPFHVHVSWVTPGTTSDKEVKTVPWQRRERTITPSCGSQHVVRLYRGSNAGGRAPVPEK